MTVAPYVRFHSQRFAPVSTFEEIKAAADEVGLHEIPVPEWKGIKLLVRKLGGAEFLHCDALRVRLAKSEKPHHRDKKTKDLPPDVRERRVRDSRLYFAAIIAATAVDANWQPIFTGAKNRVWLEAQDYLLLGRVADEILAFSGLAEMKTPEAMLEAAGADPTDSEASASTTKTSGRARNAKPASSPGG